MDKIDWEELENWLEDLRNIIFELNIALNNAKYIMTTDEPEEKKIFRHGFYQHHIRQLRFIIVVHLCKLYDNSRNQKRNLLKLIERLKSNSYEDKFLHQLSNSSKYPNKLELVKAIDELKKEIEEEQSVFQRLKEARNWLYAHKDPDKTVEYIKWTDLERLVTLASKSYNTIHGGIHNSNMMFEMTGDWHIKSLIKNHVLYKIKVRENRNNL